MTADIESSGFEGDAASDGAIELATPTLRSTPILVGTAALVLVIDRATKWWAESSLEEPVDIFWTLRFSLHENTGAAFSRFTGMGPVIAVLAVIVVLVLLHLGRGVQSVLGAVALGLILGGAAGNLVDRVIRAKDGLLSGAVVDFIDLQWWPVFNVADMGIVVGGLLVLFSSLRGNDPVFGGTNER